MTNPLILVAQQFDHYGNDVVLKLGSSGDVFDGGVREIAEDLNQFDFNKKIRILDEQWERSEDRYGVLVVCRLDYLCQAYIERGECLSARCSRLVF